LGVLIVVESDMMIMMMGERGITEEKRGGSREFYNGKSGRNWMTCGVDATWSCRIVVLPYSGCIINYLGVIT
jgi:hypothetical protein